MQNKINLRLFVGILFFTALSFITACNNKSDYPVTAAATGTGGGPGANEVWMQGMAFNPQSKTIAPGNTVTWTNKDSYPHTATSGVPNAPDGLFNSGNLADGASYSLKFNTVGTYNYYCIIHGAMMTGTIIVQAGYVP
jgi:plastocyanin